MKKEPLLTRSPSDISLRKSPGMVTTVTSNHWAYEVPSGTYESLMRMEHMHDKAKCLSHEHSPRLGIGCVPKLHYNGASQVGPVFCSWVEDEGGVVI